MNRQPTDPAPESVKGAATRRRVVASAIAVICAFVLVGTSAAFAFGARHRNGAEAVAESFGFPLTPGEMFAAQAAVTNKIEQSIASCMKSNGENYNPALTDAAEEFSRLGGDLTPEQYASTFGFGLAEGLIRTVSSGSMSTSSAGTSEKYMQYVDACRASAVDTLGVADRKLVDAVDAYENSRGAIDRALRNDPEVLKLRGQWSACMARHGYTFGNEEELASGFINQFDSLLKGLGGFVVGGAGGAPADIRPDARSALEAFKKSEIDAAEASVACRSELDGRLDDAEARVVSETLAGVGRP